MLGIGKGYGKPDFIKAITHLLSRYQALISEHSLNPKLLESLNTRVFHARTSGRDPLRFLKEEIQAFEDLEKTMLRRQQKILRQEEAHRRHLAGETLADKVLNEYRQRIEHYPVLPIHQDADTEVAKLYGAMAFFDKYHWGALESFLRRSFPGIGQIDKSGIEQHFWRFVSPRKGHLPEELNGYRMVLATPSTSSKEKIKAAQNAITAVALFLHELLELGEHMMQQCQSNDAVSEALDYVHNMIRDFRLKDLKKR